MKYQKNLKTGILSKNRIQIDKQNKLVSFLFCLFLFLMGVMIGELIIVLSDNFVFHF